jgi:hypothetical protein
MIAAIQFPNGLEADLNDDGVWECELIETEELLNLRYNPRQEQRYNKIACLFGLGVVTVYRLEYELKGNVEIIYRPKVAPLPKGAVS